MMVESNDVRQCLCLHLRRSARQVTQLYDNSLRGSGLKTTQFQLLATISQAGPTAQQPLADIMGMDRTTLTRNLALLERKGFVSITTAHRDRRERAIELTSLGQRAFKETLPLWRSAQVSMKERMSRNSAIPGFEDVLKVLEQTSTASEG